MTSYKNAHAFDGGKDSDVSWSRSGYGVVVGTSYKDYRDALKKQMADLLQSSAGLSKAESNSKAEQLLKMNENGEGYPANEKGNLTAVDFDAYQYRTNSVSDASIGGNDAINPYAAFNLDDDIVHDVSRVDEKFYFGMGRCYYEMYDSKQQILYLTMGVSKFKNLRTWLYNATDRELCELNDTGTVSLMTKLGRLFESGLSLAIQLPWLPIIWTAKIFSSIKDFRVSEYFYFRDTMSLYYRYANTIMSELAVSMGIYGNAESNGANTSPTQIAKYRANLPAIMQEGPDIFQILAKRGRRMSQDTKIKSTDDLLSEAKNPKATETFVKGKKGFFASGLSNLWTGIQVGALEGANFLGFRVERNDSANESFSNSTQDSPLLATLNSEVAANREKNNGAESGGSDLLSKLNNLSQTVSRGLSRWKQLKEAKGVNGVADGIKGAIAYMASGNGYFDLPKQWSNSAGMSRSVNYNMKLRAKTGGDNVSIYQSIMIPLSCLLAAALPRAAGDSTYTSPFLVRAFCKGMYSIPAGIITTLSVTRGAGEYGWSINHLPTVVDVSFTIDDLSPMLFLSISAGSGSVLGLGLGTIMQSFANNTKMHEYLSTLSGIGAKERYYRLGQLKRRMSAAMLINKNTTFSATYQGYALGDSSFVRTLMAVTPWTGVRNN